MQEFLHERLGFNLPGFGWLLRKYYTKDAVIEVFGKKLFVNHKIADNYARLINHRFNEPETHLFIDRLIVCGGAFQFIEVGANVGEFVLDYADRASISEVIAFEPQPEQFKSLVELVRLNNFQKVRLFETAVSEQSGVVYFNISEHNTAGAGISAAEGVKVTCTTLDDTKIDQTLPCILLMDVEGHELSVMKGGRNFIRQNHPIIIFEYNHVSKQYFSIDAVQTELGKEYSIYRLNRNGYLDLDFSATWNLVALPNEFPMRDLIHQNTPRVTSGRP